VAVTDPLDLPDATGAQLTENPVVRIAPPQAYRR
jgi:hypothetical protein